MTRTTKRASAAPRDGLGSHGAEEVSGRDEDGRDRRAQRREQLGAGVAAELPGDECSEHDERGVQQRGHDREPEPRRAEDLGVDAVEERRERRVVDVAPRQPPALGEVIELVAVVAVDRRGGEVEHEDDRGDAEGACHGATRLFVTSSTTVARAISSSIPAPSWSP